MKIICLMFMSVLFFSCDKNDYKKIVNPAYEIKRADKNRNPVFDGEIEPPIPTDAEIEDEDNILGPDRNNNGVRDDIDIWINRTAKNYNERMAMKQYSRSIQNNIKGAVEKDYKNAENYMNKFLESGGCLRVFFQDKDRVDLDRLIYFISYYPEKKKKNDLMWEIIQHVGKTRYVFRNGRDIFNQCYFEVHDQENILSISEKNS